MARSRRGGSVLARLFSKHPTVREVSFSDFSGGLNLSAPAEALAQNEAQVLNNFEFDPATGALRSRGGLAIRQTYSSAICDVIPLPEKNECLVILSDKGLYWTNLEGSQKVGDITGNVANGVQYAFWKTFILIASGGKLQKYSVPNKTLATIESSPDTDIVFTRVGRVVSFSTKTDKMIQSGIADEENWFTGNSSSGKDISSQSGYIGPTFEPWEPMFNDVYRRVVPPGNVVNSKEFYQKQDGSFWSRVIGPSNTLQAVSPLPDWLQGWEGDTGLRYWTPQDAIMLRIGANDNYKIRGVATISSDIAVFKGFEGQSDKGKVYRIIGEYPNWAVREIGGGSTCVNHQSVVAGLNDTYFMASDGVSNVQTVQEYGDIKFARSGQKINPRLSLQIDSTSARMWHLARDSQIWVRPSASNLLWIFHYTVGQGAWTTFEFPSRIDGACHLKDYTVVGMGNSLYRIDSNLNNDNGNPIKGGWKPGIISGMNQFLVTRFMAAYQSWANTNAHVALGGATFPLFLGGQSSIAYDDISLAYTNNENVVPSRSAVIRHRMVYRDYDITPTIILNGGALRIMGFKLMVGEV